MNKIFCAALNAFNTQQLGAALLAVISRYVFSDWQFLIFLILFVALDTLTGMLAAWKNNQWQTQKISPFFYKLLIYTVVLVVTHGLTHYPVKGAANIVFQVFDRVAYALLMGRETVSILENLWKIDPELVPESLRKKISGAIMAVPERMLDTFTVQAKTTAETVITGTTATTTVVTETAVAPPPTPSEPAPDEAAGQS